MSQSFNNLGRYASLFCGPFYGDVLLNVIDEFLVSDGVSCHPSIILQVIVDDVAAHTKSQGTVGTCFDFDELICLGGGSCHYRVNEYNLTAVFLGLLNDVHGVNRTPCWVCSPYDNHLGQGKAFWVGVNDGSHVKGLAVDTSRPTGSSLNAGGVSKAGHHSFDSVGQDIEVTAVLVETNSQGVAVFVADFDDFFSDDVKSLVPADLFPLATSLGGLLHGIFYSVGRVDSAGIGISLYTKATVSVGVLRVSCYKLDNTVFHSGDDRTSVVAVAGATVVGFLNILATTASICCSKGRCCYSSQSCQNTCGCGTL